MGVNLVLFCSNPLVPLGLVHMKNLNIFHFIYKGAIAIVVEGHDF
jgi:hypothetical protein